MRGKAGKKDNKAATVPAVDRESFSMLTDIADGLIVLGFTDIYDMPYDSIDALLSVWEYRGQDGQIYGPFQGDQIAKWMKQGLFGGDGGVDMRKVERAVGSHAGDSDEPAAKRTRFQETKGEVDQKSNHAELLNDLEDDSDSDPEASALMGRRPMPAARVAVPLNVCGPWVNSKQLDFGDMDAPVEEDENDDL